MRQKLNDKHHERKQSATFDEEETVHVLQGEDGLRQSVGGDDLLDGVALPEGGILENDVLIGWGRGAPQKQT